MQIDKSIIQQTHSDYDAFIDQWNFFRQSYIGGHEWITSKNVFRHSREENDDYDKRLKRIVYLNYSEPVVSTYTSHIFGAEIHPTREIEDEAVVEAYQDVDRRGNPIDAFMQGIANDAQIEGYVGVVVDMPRADGAIETQADIDENNIRPYLCRYTAQSIRNWSVDRFGQLNWIRLAEEVRDDADPFAETSDPVTRYRTWTKKGWFIHDDEGEELAGGEHGLGFVPFVPIYFKRHPARSLIGLGQLNDIARINRLLVNIISYIEHFISRQAFPFLAVPEDPTVAPPEGDTTISEKHIFAYPTGGQPPSYVSPPTDPASFMRDFVSDFLRREIYRIAKLEFREIQEESGIAKRFDFHHTNNAIARFARNLQVAENQILMIWGLWGGGDTVGIVTYPDSFDIQTVNLALEDALKIRDIYGDKSPTFVSEFLKRLISRIEPKLKEDIREIIDAELEGAAVAESQLTAFDSEVRTA